MTNYFIKLLNYSTLSKCNSLLSNFRWTHVDMIRQKSSLKQHSLPSSHSDQWCIIRIIPSENSPTWAFTQYFTEYSVVDTSPLYSFTFCLFHSVIMVFWNLCVCACTCGCLWAHVRWLFVAQVFSLKHPPPAPPPLFCFSHNPSVLKPFPLQPISVYLYCSFLRHVQVSVCMCVCACARVCQSHIDFYPQ